MRKAFRALTWRAAAHIQAAKQQQKTYADKKRKEVAYKVGENVWLSTKNLKLSGSPKFKPKFIGPYAILEKINDVTYRLDIPASLNVHPVFHVNLLAPEKTRKTCEKINDLPLLRPEPMQNDAEGAVFEVEHILGQRGHGPEARYLVKWKGFPLEEATWEPSSNLEGSRALLRAFRAAQTRRERLRT